MNVPRIIVPPSDLLSDQLDRIQMAFDDACANARHQVETLHRLIAARKVGVEIPEELRIVVTIRLCEPTAAAPSAPQSAAPSTQSP